MDESIPKLPEESAALVDLGIALGRTHAFGAVAGRCSAAQAAALQRLREEKAYKRCTPFWEDFCRDYLNMSRAEADRMIRLWEEFGAGYFEVAQLVHISAAAYRAIAPSVKDGALHWGGEAIELTAGNSLRVAAAVAEHRRQAAPRQAGGAAAGARLAQLDRKSAALVAELERISGRLEHDADREAFSSILSRIQCALARMAPETGE